MTERLLKRYGQQLEANPSKYQDEVIDITTFSYFYAMISVKSIDGAKGVGDKNVQKLLTSFRNLMRPISNVLISSAEAAIEDGTYTGRSLGRAIYAVKLMKGTHKELFGS